MRDRSEAEAQLRLMEMKKGHIRAFTKFVYDGGAGAAMNGARVAFFQPRT